MWITEELDDRSSADVPDRDTYKPTEEKTQVVAPREVQSTTMKLHQNFPSREKLARALQTASASDEAVEAAKQLQRPVRRKVHQAVVGDARFPARLKKVHDFGD